MTGDGTAQCPALPNRPPTLSLFPAPHLLCPVTAPCPRAHASRATAFAATSPPLLGSAVAPNATVEATIQPFSPANQRTRQRASSSFAIPHGQWPELARAHLMPSPLIRARYDLRQLLASPPSEPPCCLLSLPEHHTSPTTAHRAASRSLAPLPAPEKLPHRRAPHRGAPPSDHPRNLLAPLAAPSRSTVAHKDLLRPASPQSSPEPRPHCRAQGLLVELRRWPPSAVTAFSP
uniref:Uncharacterized protein n=1 Tax=Setaria italica TaxID=4555 RepID=K3XLK1_SETIT